MIYCKCEQCNSIVLFQEGDIGHSVQCKKCGGRFSLSARQIVEPPVVEERPDQGRVLKFRCQCGRKLAVPFSMKAEHVKCPKCNRMAPVPPRPDDESAGPPIIPVGLDDGFGQTWMKPTPRARRMSLIATLCWVAFVFCLIAASGGLVASELKLRDWSDNVAQFNARSFTGNNAVANYAHKDAAALDETDYARYRGDFLDKEGDRWKQVRLAVFYRVAPLTGVALILGIVLSLRDRARRRRRLAGAGGAAAAVFDSRQAK
jgi:DNA-directed RNA polymerase subunit M/transcription elongation factor TFIIS